MSAELVTYDKDLLKSLTSQFMERMSQPILAVNPEWTAWASKWREEVPLGWKQRRENAAWRRRVATAKRKLKRAMDDFEQTVRYIEKEYDVEIVTCGEEGEFDYQVDDRTPPHQPTHRLKNGAPPEPSMWPSVRYGSVQFRRVPDLGSLAVKQAADQ